MSYDVHVPCNCRKTGRMRIPPFVDRLTEREGLLDLKDEFIHDRELEATYDNWDFCEHDQVAISLSFAQSLTQIKNKLRELNHSNFKDLIEFLPSYNCYFSSEYDKRLALSQLNACCMHSPRLIPKEWCSKLKALLKTAIDMEQDIYW